MGTKSNRAVQQEVANLLGAPTTLPEDSDTLIAPNRKGKAEEVSSPTEYSFGGKQEKPLKVRKARPRDQKSVAAVVKLLVMMTKLQEFRDNMHMLLTERIEQIRKKVENLIETSGISPLKSPEDRILYGDATIKISERSIRLLKDGKVTILEKMKEERFQMKADMIFMAEFNEEPVKVWAKKNKPNLIEKSESKTLDLISLEEMIRNGNAPNEVVMATKILADFAKKANIIEHQISEVVDYDYYKQLVKNNEIPLAVIMSAEGKGCYKTTVRKPLKLLDRCAACGEPLKRKLNEKHTSCTRCGLDNKNDLKLVK